MNIQTLRESAQCWLINDRRKCLSLFARNLKSALMFSQENVNLWNGKEWYVSIFGTITYKCATTTYRYCFVIAQNANFPAVGFGTLIPCIVDTVHGRSRVKLVFQYLAL